MSYELIGFVDTKPVALTITEAEFIEATQAQTRLLDALRIEEKFDMLLQNYRELEESLLERTLHHMLFVDTDYSALVSEIYLVTRKLQNLLSTARLYIDQVQHDLSSMYGKSSQQRMVFEEWLQAEHDARFEYRVMEALRNFMQHRSLPSASISIGARLRGEPPDALAVHTANPKLNVPGIRSAGGFKPNILAEMEAKGMELDLKPLVRGYVEALAAIQGKLRHLLAASTAEWEQHVNAAIHALSSHAGGGVKHVMAVARSDMTITEEYALFDDPHTRRRWLEHRNATRRRLGRQIVSSEAG